tara:strand:- start:97 stop:276 length:180 start_codon:yes stop_codon:yes gene_type:complete
MPISGTGLTMMVKGTMTKQWFVFGLTRTYISWVRMIVFSKLVGSGMVLVLPEIASIWSS